MHEKKRYIDYLDKWEYFWAGMWCGSTIVYLVMTYLVHSKDDLTIGMAMGLLLASMLIFFARWADLLKPALKEEKQNEQSN